MHIPGRISIISVLQRIYNPVYWDSELRSVNPFGLQKHKLCFILKMLKFQMLVMIGLTRIY